MKELFFQLRAQAETNSSSSHAMVYRGTCNENLLKRFTQKPKMYGWNDFVLLKRPDKAHYLFTQLCYQIQRDLKCSEDASKRLAASLFEDKIDLKRQIEHIDHQSQYVFPFTCGTEVICFDFAKELVQFLMDNDDIIIIGGNDNESRTDDLRHSANTHILFEIILKDNHYCGFECFPVAKHNWVLIDKKTREKIRIGFNGKWQPHVPEIIDIKITNYCTHNCSFCYTGSTEFGEHASLKNLNFIFDRISYDLVSYTDPWKVPEIVLGGGSPIMHPDIWKLTKKIKKDHDHNISTTIANLTELEENKEKLKDHFDSVGVTYKQFDFQININSLKSFVSDGGWESTPVVVHFIDRIDTTQQVLDFIDYCGAHGIGSYGHARSLTILLLGFKRSGRGTNFSFQNPPLDFDKIKEHAQWMNIGCDNAFIEDHNLPKDPISYMGREGQYSMFIDAVNGNISTSSYSSKVIGNILDDEHCRLKDLWEKVKQASNIKQASSIYINKYNESLLIQK